jgi:ABC-2 type transport system ATP-binding protein
LEQYILEVNGLVKRYKDFSLEKVTFSLPEGYIMGFIGQNGAGKSTTIKAIMNLVPFEAGDIKIFGLDNKDHTVELRNKIGYVSEEQYFYEKMSVDWTGKFIGSFYPNWDQHYFEKLLNQFKVEKTKKIKELSKGMKVKLSMALALAHHPKLLILDEPTSGLDPVIRNELLELFLDLIQDEKTSILFSSHITSDIEKVADYITIINDGKVIISEDKHGILENWGIIKAENSYFHQEIANKLAGLNKGDFGYSGATPDLEAFEVLFRKIFPQGKYLVERITLDELLLRIVKDSEENVAIIS